MALAAFDLPNMLHSSSISLMKKLGLNDVTQLNGDKDRI
jgi:hypothetical protein